ncbi:MAG: UDP-N-acetylmuramate dehydrogenase [Gammaproteobacteria bacterium]|nr:UDP-N-acetylmuramate dehydrogenase [Gammaproteobacteria bacterium]
MISTKNLHTFHLNTVAANVLHIDDESQLSQLWELPGPFMILGQGSNTVFIEDYDGHLVINELKGVEFSETEEHYLLSVKSGENWHELIKYCLSKQIYGFENLALIPGTVGAAPIQNIGAYGIEIERFIKTVHFYQFSNNEIKTLSREQCQFGYRDSIFKKELKQQGFITQVDFLLPKQWQPVCIYAPLNTLESPTAHEIFEQVCHTRKQKLPDPAVLGNAGSFFKNPIVEEDVATSLLKNYPNMPCYEVDYGLKKLAAGWLIEQAGLKGFVHKNVAVHDAQALVLVNKSGKASGEELLQLISIVKDKVLDCFAIELEPEVQLIGRQGDLSV